MVNNVLLKELIEHDMRVAIVDKIYFVIEDCEFPTQTQKKFILSGVDVTSEIEEAASMNEKAWNLNQGKDPLIIRIANKLDNNSYRIEFSENHKVVLLSRR